MTPYTLTVIDTPGIQPYIFGSNRLLESIGASELVQRATTLWPLELLGQAGDTNVRDGEIDNALHIEDGKLDAEIIYSGGGNALILFCKRERAVEFVIKLSQRVLEEAPGLELVVAHTEVEWEHLPAGLDNAMKALARVKNSRQPSAPLLGLGVTVACESTGLVATDVAPKDGYPISDAVRAKLAMANEAENRLKDVFSADFLRENDRFPRNFEDFGTKGQMSYLAVVHADGNGMGKFFRDIGAKHSAPREYIDALRAASDAVKRASRQALNQLGGALLRPDLRDKHKIPFPKGYVPFRPLVFGGDDVTFVCDGRLGLTLAAAYLEAFEAATQAEPALGKDGLRACAGIAVVKTHYPFARAYALSEELAKNAKKYVRKTNTDFSALDWHFAASGLSGSLDTIRKREYLSQKDKHLEVRPLRLRPAGREWRTWPGFVNVVREFKKQAEGSHNKVIALREVLREGPEAVIKYCHDFAYELPVLDATNESLQKTGWHGDHCGYSDAIEALDFYTSLTGDDDGNL